MSGWFLDAAGYGNPASGLLREHGPWTAGNEVRALVHGAAYFARLQAALRDCGSGDLVLFADWRGDPDQQLTGPGTAVAVEVGRAASAGAVVKGLVWRSHTDRFRFSSAENRNLAEALCALGADALLDERVRRAGSHHQKFVVIRHPGRPTDDVAFLGGIDLGHSRRDDTAHGGDPQVQEMSRAYGDRPPWHDVQLEIRGPAVAAVEACFRERWTDPRPVAAPWSGRGLLDRFRGVPDHPDRLPAPLPPPPPRGRQLVQLLRTYPHRTAGYPFAPRGEFSVARGYRRALARARRLVYVEDQFLWSREVAGVFAAALRARPELHLVGVLPRHPDGDGRVDVAVEHWTHRQAITTLRRAGGGRVALFDLENHAGTPVYVHAKVCVVDDEWAAVGSANLNRRSWTADSELAAAVVDEPSGDPGREGAGYAARLRAELWREHLDLPPDRDPPGPADPARAVETLRAAARALEDWHRGGRRGPRPPGRLREHARPAARPLPGPLAPLLLRAIYDPDGRPPELRRQGEF